MLPDVAIKSHPTLIKVVQIRPNSFQGVPKLIRGYKWLQGVLMKSVAKSGQKSYSKGFHQVPSRPNSFKVVQIRSKEFQRVPWGSYEGVARYGQKSHFKGLQGVPRGSIAYKGFQRVPRGSKVFL